MENEHYSFIIDCLADPGNAAKQRALNQWLAASEEQRILFREVKMLWEAAGALPAAPLDQAAGWEALSQQIVQTPAVRVRRMRGWWKAAAIVLPLLMAAGYWFYHTTQNSRVTYTAGSAYKDSLLLPDGTAVYLQRGARLSWKKGFKERQIRLEEGEVFFKIAKDEQRSFSISAANATIKVLGTAFNVRTSPAFTDVVVWEGKVSLAGDRLQPVILRAGELGIVEANNAAASKLAGNYQYRCGWANNELVFDKQPVAVVVRILSAYYHVKLEVPDTLLNRRITVRFSHLPVNEAVGVLSAVLDHELKIKSDTLIH